MSSDPLVLMGARVLTLDPEATVFESASVRIEDGRLAAIGSDPALAEGATVADCAGCIVLPGLIQGHVHLGQTLFRGLGEGRRLLAWLRERIWPLEAAHDDESAYWSARLGAAECLLGGTTTVQDIGLGPGAEGLLAGIADSGLRARAGMCLMDGGEGMPEGLAGTTDAVLDRTLALGEDFERRDPGRLCYALNPRFILSCSDALWDGIRELAEARRWAVHTHALEQREEGAAVQASKGCDEIVYFAEHGLLDRELSIAHGVWLTAEHRGRVADAPFGVVHCPSSNLKLGSGIAPVVDLVAEGIPVGIGADGAPCNNDLDGLEEIRLAALLQSLERGPGSLDGATALRLATSDGARAIGWSDQIGSIEVGKAADLVVLEASGPELVAHETVDPHDLVTFSATRAAVRDVYVGGEARVLGGALVGQDLAEIRRRAAASLGLVVERSGLAL